MSFFHLGGTLSQAVMIDSMRFQPMPLVSRAEPFSHADWLFEVKWDGFRSLASIENGRCRLVSQNGNGFKSFPDLIISLPLECHAERAVLDGEVVSLDDTGYTNFENLLFCRAEPRFYAFDLLSCDGSVRWYKIRNLNYSRWSDVKSCSSESERTIRSLLLGTRASKRAMLRKRS